MDINSERHCLFISSLKTDIHLYKFISYVIKITQQIRYKGIRLMLFGKIIHVYFEKRKKRVTTLCEQNGEFLNAEAGGTHSNSGASIDQYHALHLLILNICNFKFNNRISVFQCPT